MESRSVQRRVAAQKGLPAPDFSKPDEILLTLDEEQALRLECGKLNPATRMSWRDYWLKTQLAKCDAAVQKERDSYADILASKDAECQARVERIFKEIESKEEQDMKSDTFSVNEYMNWWQALKKQEGLK